MTLNEMAIERYKIAIQLIETGNALLDPNADYHNVCSAMDSLSYALNILDDIRHNAFPEWFKEKSNGIGEDDQ